MHTSNINVCTDVNTVARKDTDGYQLCLTVMNFDSTEYITEWKRLLSRSESCEKIYQSPEFFRYLVESYREGSDKFVLYTVYDNASNVIGILPLRMSLVSLEFKAGSFSFYRYQVPVIRILGSLPLLEGNDELKKHMMHHLLSLHPAYTAISMQCYPIENKNDLKKDRRLKFFTIHGWRPCHVIPPTPDFESYLQKMNAKKRYNVARETRRLEKQTGLLTLRRIIDPADVPELFACFASLLVKPGRNGLSEEDYTIFAKNAISLSYTIRAGPEAIAAILGSYYGNTWHVHRIDFSQKFRHLSAGSVAMHLAFEDVAHMFPNVQVDFGYGVPKKKFASTHVIRERAHVLVARHYSVRNLILHVFVAYEGLHSALAIIFKSLRIVRR